MDLMLLALDMSTVVNWLLVLVGLGLVVFFHELGHFLAAKWAGIKVEIFSLGFGPRLFGRRGKETDYRVSLLPLGGYVKMLGQDDIGEVKKSDDPRSYLNKPVGRRVVVIAAGVLMNVVFAFLAFTVLYLIGKPYSPAVAGAILPGWPADQAGLRPGDRIVKVNDQPIIEFRDIQQQIALNSGPVRLTVERDGRQIELPAVTPRLQEAVGVYALGIEPAPGTQLGLLAPAIALTRGDCPLRTGDVLVAVGGAPAQTIAGISELAQATNGLASLDFTVLRDGKRLTVPVAVPPDQNGRRDWPFTLAARSLPPGANVVAIDGHDTPRTVSSACARLAGRFEEAVSLAVIDAGGKQWTIQATTGPVQAECSLAGMQPAVAVGWLADKKDPAVEAGLRRGDVIAKAADEAWPSFESLRNITKAHKDLPLELIVLRPGEAEPLKITVTPKEDGGQVLIGIAPGVPAEPRVGMVAADGPAGKAAVKPGSVIRTAGGEPVADWAALMRAARKAADAGEPLKVAGVTEDDQPFTADLGAIRRDEMPCPLLLGAWTNGLQDTQQTANPLQALAWSGGDTVDSIGMMYRTIAALFTQRVKTKALSGPVGILQIAEQSAASGLPTFLWFLGFISINLAVVNFLPILPLDGGHIVLLLYEKIRGKAAPLKLQYALALLGWALLLTLIIFVTFNDIGRWFSR